MTQLQHSPLSSHSTPKTSDPTTNTDLVYNGHQAHQTISEVTLSSDSALITQYGATSHESTAATVPPSPVSTGECTGNVTVNGPLGTPGSHLSTSSSPLWPTLTESFPIFSTGDVAIHTYQTAVTKKWHLHSSALARHSTWFAQSLQEHQASATSRRETPHFAYAIKLRDGHIRLTSETAKDDRSEVSKTSEGSFLSEVSIKVEDDGKDEAIINIFDQILGAFYSIPPQITSTNVKRATMEAEQLVKVANDLGCTHLISSHVGNALLQHRQILYKAILADPARYLLLAIALKNDFIYTESLIHIIGAYPWWPWPTSHKLLSEDTRLLIAKKSQELETEVLEAERALLLLTITRGPRKEPFRCDASSEFDTWFVVQLFRDTLTNVLRQHDVSKPSLKRGSLFRKIKTGGSQYMVYEEVRQMMQRVMPSAVNTLDEDLRILKEFASSIVEDLARNELSLDVRDHQVGWLTCVKIQTEDIPWRAEAKKGV
ncbi:hypothetical protein OPT61_g6638 [Boeremia exigua]|uniref:Uncharacterized protein n=1 Tax=Boeremia exigua TaxID=749465 RepID=A0ACC2I595_9PLEO|nr:hypothetical protein OPT61_g6638 [Boeremia exigua]